MPYEFKTFCSSSHKSKGYRKSISSKMPCVHFSIQKDHASIGRWPAGHLAATGLRLHIHLLDLLLPSSYRLVTKRSMYESCYHFCSTIHKNQTFQSNQWEFSIMPSKRKIYSSISVISTLNWKIIMRLDINIHFYNTMIKLLKYMFALWLPSDCRPERIHKINVSRQSEGAQTMI